VHLDQQVPLGGREVDLLGQLPLRRPYARLAADVGQPGRQLVQVRPHRVAVLAHQRDPAVVVERDHRRRAEMAGVVAPGRRSARHGHLVGHHVEDHAVELLLGRQDAVLVSAHRTAAAGWPLDPLREPAVPMSTGSRSAAL
jgi:hypothetical protein